MNIEHFNVKAAVLASGILLLLAAMAPAVAQNAPGWRGGPAVTVQPLTATETQWLQFMREEEKLARDVYQQLFQKWSLPAFQNIAIGEQRHFESMGVLLVRYGVADPALSGAGVYTDTRLNALYNELMAKGLRSAQDALEVGVLIEKRDIEDLESALKETNKVDLKRVYTNLMNASYRHLDAFETGCLLTAAAAPANR